MLSNEIRDKRIIRQSRCRKFMNSQEKIGGGHELDQKISANHEKEMKRRIGL